jgi:hypothetical protein
MSLEEFLKLFPVVPKLSAFGGTAGLISLLAGLLLKSFSTSLPTF